ncbi:MAG TPA: tetratricopeptide repeat protein [Candidatus Wallbacteria bacterium]|nr:tetratricopeptide repeat protein [Candidatus Wallbacteria bacterium]
MILFKSFFIPRPAFASSDVDETALYLKGIELIKSANYNEALTCFNKILKYNINNSRVKAIREKLLEKIEKVKENETGTNHHEKEIEEKYNEGNALMEIEMFEDALKCFDKALGIDNKSAVLWFSRAMALKKLLKFELAVVSFDQALAINPSFSDAWYNKAACLSKLNKLEEALECFNEIVEIDPDHMPDKNL